MEQIFKVILYCDENRMVFIHAGLYQSSHNIQKAFHSDSYTSRPEYQKDIDSR